MKKEDLCINYFLLWVPLWFLWPVSRLGHSSVRVGIGNGRSLLGGCRRRRRRSKPERSRPLKSRFIRLTPILGYCSCHRASSKKDKAGSSSKKNLVRPSISTGRGNADVWPRAALCAALFVYLRTTTRSRAPYHMLVLSIFQQR